MAGVIVLMTFARLIFVGKPALKKNNRFSSSRLVFIDFIICYGIEKLMKHLYLATFRNK